MRHPLAHEGQQGSFVSTQAISINPVHPIENGRIIGGSQIIKPLDPVRLARVRNAVQEALSILLDHLQTEGIMDWHQRCVGIGDELERDNYELVVQMVSENHEVSTREAERMDLLPHYLDSQPQEESERLERGHRKHAKHHKAFIYSLQLLRATDTLRVYTSYRIFNEPPVIQKLR